MLNFFANDDSNCLLNFFRYRAVLDTILKVGNESDMADGLQAFIEASKYSMVMCTLVGLL